jgi:acetyltransferase-like isoleucine patch superfamily enzyme
MTGDFYVHPQGIVEPGATIGPGSRIWAFSHVLPGALVGAECNICDHVFIENDVSIGDRVTIKSGVQLWDGITLEDDVFVGPNTAFTNDPYPRSKKHPEAYSRTVVRRRASIGANATILPGVTIGPGAMIGAGAVVTHSVPPNAMVTGNPGRVVEFVDPYRDRPLAPLDHPDRALQIPAARLVSLPVIAEERGKLTVAQFESGLPFAPLRCFFVSDVPQYEVRGLHAHRIQHQFLVCVHGSCNVVLDDGAHSDEIHLHTPSMGLHVPPLIWGVQYKYSPGAVLLVLTSGMYDPADYIREYEELNSLAVRSR